MTKKIVLCADDYGQSIPISQAILDLVERQRLSAVSCIVNALTSELAATWLRIKQNQVDIGLHINLTEGKPLSSLYQQVYGERFLGLHSLIYSAICGQLNLAVVRAECEAQLERFRAYFGFPPDFIDGHQHVHQLPCLRDVIIHIFKQQLPKHAYMRLVNPTLFDANLLIMAKRLVLKYLGGKAFAKLLQQTGIAHNSTFSGIYLFKGDYRQFFTGFLQQIGQNGLIMCHPGSEDLANNDPIAKARLREYHYFLSNEFIEECRQVDAKLVRFASRES